MEALKFYVKIGESGKIDLPELGKLKGRRAELIILESVKLVRKNVL